MKITQRKGKAAFTLIELMAVITIIVILAGLVVGGMGFVTDRQAKEKAKEMRRAEFHKRVAAIPRPNPAAYNASVADFKARNLWQERWSHEPHSQDYINHRAIKNEYRAAIAAYNERVHAIAAEFGFA